ncbi:DUF3703 domain-containing protein [Alteromonas sp. LOR]|uniref:DUF3703 domain-containing protein n=1 Tax=unclassified Alteromonas TaxID=2614992 RepID=UPI000A7D20CF
MVDVGIWRSLQDSQRSHWAIWRLLGAITKTVVGLLPHGNTGGSNISAFKSMPISEQNQIVLAKINAKT